MVGLEFSTRPKIFTRRQRTGPRSLHSTGEACEIHRTVHTIRDGGDGPATPLSAGEWRVSRRPGACRPLFLFSPKDTDFPVLLRTAGPDSLLILWDLRRIFKAQQQRSLPSVESSPEGIGLNIIEPAAEKNSRRMDLFNRLDVQRVTADFIRGTILSKHREYRMNPSAEQARLLPDQLQFLYLTHHLDSNRNLYRTNVLVGDGRDWIFASHHINVYLPNDHEFGAKKLLDYRTKCSPMLAITHCHLLESAGAAAAARPCLVGVLRCVKRVGYGAVPQPHSTTSVDIKGRTAGLVLIRRSQNYVS